MIARVLFKAVVPDRGPMALLGDHETLSRGPRDLEQKNTYFGHECERKFWEKYLQFEMKTFFFVLQRKFRENTFDLR